jgi:hypothetical protein
MVVTTDSRTPSRRSPTSIRAWLLLVAVAAAVVLGIFGARAILGGPQLSSSAGACTEVTSAACRPFLDAMYENLGGQGSEVASVRGAPWCGQDSCQVLFGGEALRLHVTFSDGTSEEFSCWRPPLGIPSCQPAASPEGL